MISQSSEMQESALKMRAAGKRLALVPTMGALHQGHLHLVDIARQHADVVIMSIFVNPTQFGPSEDFQKYPRNLQRDAELAQSRGVDILFTPTPAEIYPEDHQTWVEVTELSQGLCGARRPGHFRGVTTVVAALFLITQPHGAIFGEKDYQQLAVIRRMVKDLHFPIEIIGAPIQRDPDGLAMSSRNVYLSPEERQEALQLSQSIRWAQEQVAQGETDSQVLIGEIRKKLSRGKNTQIDYIEIIDDEKLTTVSRILTNCRILLATFVGKTRLIDNGPLSPGLKEIKNV